jgi:hypothetical protein
VTPAGTPIVLNEAIAIDGDLVIRAYRLIRVENLRH